MSVANINRAINKMRLLENTATFMGVLVTTGIHSNPLIEIARSILNARLQTTEERAAIPFLMESFESSLLGGRVRKFTMSSFIVRDSEDQTVTKKRFDDLRGQVTNWVNEQKIKTDRDSGKTPERIARDVYFGMLEKPEPFFTVDKEGHGLLNPRGLARYLDANVLSAPNLGDILSSVLQAWKANVISQIPVLVSDEIKGALK